jgi:hypothetical protein
MRSTVLAAAALLLTACDGPLLFAELEIPEIRITLPSQEFPPAALGPPCSLSQPGCVSQELSFDLGAEVPVVTEPNVTYHLRLTSLAIVLQSSSTADLDAFEAVRIVLTDPATGDEVVLASYERSAADQTEIRVAGNAGVDLARYIVDGALDVRAELTYDPTQPAPGGFTADVETGFAFDAKIDWGAYL